MQVTSNATSHGNDPLNRFDRAGIVQLLAAYYRGLGWWVERQADRDFDLCLKRDREVMLLHCGHWSAKSVPHSAVHELLGMMVNENASSAVLVSRGTFTPPANEAADRHGHVRLVDIPALRDMLGVLPDMPAHGDPFVESDGTSDVRAFEMAEAARPRHASARAGSRVQPHVRTRTWVWLFSLLCFIAFVLVVIAILKKTSDTVAAPPDGVENVTVSKGARESDHSADFVAHVIAADAAAVLGDEQAVQKNADAAVKSYMKAIRLADPAREVDRESARIAVRNVEAVRSVAWIDRDNLFVIVRRNEDRNYATIDSICSRMSPLGDTLGVVVHLQSGAAVRGDDLEILSRNCELAPGERALLQNRRDVDVVPIEVRAQHRANNADATPESLAEWKRRNAESMKALEGNTPEL